MRSLGGRQCTCFACVDGFPLRCFRGRRCLALGVLRKPGVHLLKEEALVTVESDRHFRLKKWQCEGCVPGAWRGSSSVSSACLLERDRGTTIARGWLRSESRATQFEDRFSEGASEIGCRSPRPPFRELVGFVGRFFQRRLRQGCRR